MEKKIYEDDNIGRMEEIIKKEREKEAAKAGAEHELGIKNKD